MPDTDRDSLKRAAAIYATRFIEPGMTIGLGTGSTAIHAVHEIARRFKAGELPDIKTFATSSQTARAASDAGLPVCDPHELTHVDVTIDGADEVDPALDIIKGGGGALLHEKIVAQSTLRQIIVVDDSKLSPRLGTLHALPIEVLPFGCEAQKLFLEELGGNPTLRLAADGTPFRTDEGNYIYDCDFGPIHDLDTLEAELSLRTGVVDHGMFLGMTDDLIVASPDGIQHITRDPVTDALTTVRV